ncbi:uncharacterized protein LOC126679894 [Mercurialis annua]|uniref:uncharacterized protein LOC126679894 n=1 Tax=Mercurialis annua TaxID=3986 RepID=UPI00215E37E2|nr:uncharacterized protein LOC126679894 [Mercurialis annua]
MADGVSVKQSAPPAANNQCCKAWRKKCLKLEAGRKHLKEAVQILYEQVDKIQAEKLAIKKACEEEQAQAATVKEKDLAARVALESEVCSLKSEVSSLKQTCNTDVVDNKGELKLLKDNVSKAEKEIVRLKALVEKEKTRADSEKKSAEAQKKSASEAWKLMKAEKIKADEERKLAFTQEKKAEEYRLQLEACRKEAEEAKSKLVFEANKFEEAGKTLEAEKHKVIKERKSDDSEMAKIEEQKRLVEANEKKFMEEKSRADNLSQQLEEARQKIEDLQKDINNIIPSRNLDSEYPCDQSKAHTMNTKISFVPQKENLDVQDKMREVKFFQDCISEGEKQISYLKVLLEKEKEKADHIKKNAEEEKKSSAEAWTFVKVEKEKVDEEKKNVDIERKKADNYRIQLEALRKDANATKAKLKSEILQLKKAIKELEKEKRKIHEEVMKRFEDAKQNAMVEKKATEIRLVEAEEQRKLVEENRKMALEEKSRADQLSCQLEESRHKVEDLQKQIQEILSSRKPVEASTILPRKGRNAETRNLKLLEKQLKLEKMRLNYAKQVANLEKNRNSILQKELAHINMDSVQISRRLGALDKWFKCREDLEKAENMRSSKLKRKFSDLEPFPMYAQTEKKLVKSSCLAMAGFDPIRESTVLQFPLSGGNCTASISGIDSKLEPLHGGSSQKLLQNSAMNSSSASFSDGQLAGSQERGAFVSITPEKCVQENDGQTTSCMSGEVTKTQGNGNLAVVAENSVKSPQRIYALGKINGRARKFNSALSAIESVEILCSEGKKLHMQMEEKLYLLHGMINGETNKQVEEPKYVEVCVHDDVYNKFEKGQKTRKGSCDERSRTQQLCTINEQEKITQTGNHINGDVNVCRLGSSSTISSLGIPQECVKGLNDSPGNDLETLKIVEHIENGDYMKLLDLDNIADEECYRRAVKMPLSPTLPDIEISDIEMFDIRKSKVVSSFNGGMSYERDVVVPSYSFDVGISSNNMRCNASRTPFIELLHEDEGLVDSLHMLGNGNGYFTVDTERISERQPRDPEVVEMLKTSSSGIEGLKSLNIKSGSELGCVQDSIPAFCVVFSNVTDCTTVSRIFCATRTCAIRYSLDSERECTVQKILHALKMEEKLLPKEKACVFFTLLLLNFSWCTSLRSERSADKGFFLCLDSYGRQFSAVASDVEARSLLAHFCSWDEVVGLIEDFLINGRLMVHTDASSETLNGCDLRMNISIEGMHINLSSKPASADQLVAGSTILASVCSAIDHIEFLCEASYNLLRCCKYDAAVLLTILHVFSYLGGDKFFSLKEHGLIMTVLKSIVVLLEGENSSDTSDSCLSPSHEVRSKLHLSAECPFGTESVDMVISLLLEKLHSHAFSVIMHPHLTESINSSNFHVLRHEDNASQSSSHEQIFGAHGVYSGGLDKCSVSSTHANSGTSFDLNDVLSLVELVAGYTSWDWICGKVIPVLLEFLGRSLPEDFAVAVVLLIGQIGRLGVTGRGCKDKEVENLKSKLHGFLWRNNSMTASLPVQIATITSLLGLLCLDFEDAVHGTSDLPEFASQFVYIDPIRKWFSALSEEQQTLACSLLQSTAVTTS